MEESHESEGAPASVAVDIEDLLMSLMNKKLREIEADKESNHNKCTIFRVLPSVRDQDNASYDPKIISIGPFHHGKKELQTMQNLKWRFLYDLIGRSSQNSLQNYIKAVRSIEADPRDCYSEKLVEPDVTEQNIKCKFINVQVSPNNSDKYCVEELKSLEGDCYSVKLIDRELSTDAFVQMMVLDGCFIIEFLIKYLLGIDVEKNQLSMNWIFPLLRNDLFRLENQIPFSVLKSLFESSVIPSLVTLDGYAIQTLTELALYYLNRGETSADNKSSHPVPVEVHHLLHLYHSTLSPEDHDNKSKAYSCLQLPFKKIKQVLLYSFYWLMSLILYCRLPPGGGADNRAPRMIPSATQLHEAGVKFKRKKGTKCMLDVSFSNGILEMPLLSIQAATIPLFRNLVAFEQCLPESGSRFTSYVVLLDNLIDTADDVLVLEAGDIIESKLGGAEEVAKLINGLSKGAYLNYEKHALKKLFEEVKEYAAAESNQWRARLVHDYFGNPWSIISLIAAIVLLILAAVQSIFAVVAFVAPPDNSSPAGPPPSG